MKIRKQSFIFITLMLVLLAGCSGKNNSESVETVGAETAGAETITYQHVTAEEAKNVMDSDESIIILDVRTQSEYEEGHIPGAVLIPHDTVADKAEELLPDKDQKILVYCRSGNRSRQASEVLTGLGYTNIIEFGGIIDWPYEIES